MYILPDKMYIMAEERARWTIARARQELPKLIALAAREPQAVYRRDKLVAQVVSPELGRAIEDNALGAHVSIADALVELRRLCAEESYQLPVPRRRDRRVPFRVPQK